MKLGLIQTKQNILYDFANPHTFSAEERLRLSEEMVEQNIRLINEAAALGADLILTSEAINFTGTPVDRETFDIIPEYDEDGGLIKRLRDISAKTGSAIVAGLYNRRGGKAYNSAVYIDRGGAVLEIYDKNNLAGDENIALTPGTEQKVFDTEFGRIALLICWDMQQPEFVKQTAELGAELILCPTWGWEMQYGLKRATENNANIAVAMGVPYGSPIEGVRDPSMLLLRDGSIVKQASRDKAEALIANVEIRD